MKISFNHSQEVPFVDFSGLQDRSSYNEVHAKDNLIKGLIYYSQRNVNSIMFTEAVMSKSGKPRFTRTAILKRVIDNYDLGTIVQPKKFKNNNTARWIQITFFYPTKNYDFLNKVSYYGMYDVDKKKLIQKIFVNKENV